MALHNLTVQAFLYKKVLCKKVVLEWPKPQESCSTSSKKLKKFLKIFYVESNNFRLFGKPTRDKTEIEIVTIILVQ